jgi:hypothetical protein
MASEVKVDKLTPATGTALQIGDASDTITIPTGATFTITDGLGVGGGGTGLTSFTAGDVLYATGTTTLAKLAKGTAEQVLAMNSGETAPDWGSVDLTVLPTITVATGGTNLTTFTAGDVLYATGSTTLAKLAKPGTPADEVLTFATGASAPSWAAGAAAGKIGQVLNVELTSTVSATATTLTDVAGLTLDITPVATSSKILMVYNICLGTSSLNYRTQVAAMRGSTQIGVGDAASSRARTAFASHTAYSNTTNTVQGLTQSILDSPNTTSATTYKVQAQIASAATMYVNQMGQDLDDANVGRGSSGITLMEILA